MPEYRLKTLPITSPDGSPTLYLMSGLSPLECAAAQGHTLAMKHLIQVGG